MPRKLGQHFLKDAAALEKIARALEIKRTDVVVEIGPGHGELSRHLLNFRPKKLILIEKDPQLASRLPAELKSSLSGTTLEIILGDAREILPGLRLHAYKLIGNIPYYITGQLLRILSELKNKPRLIILTVQKEVAERIAAEPPRMNLLAAITQFWSEPKILGIVPREKFSPAPQVDSAIIQLVPKETKEAERYYRLAKILFRQPRKTIVNNLLSQKRLNKGKVIEILDKEGIIPSERPQNLDIGKIILLANRLEDDIL